MGYIIILIAILDPPVIRAPPQDDDSYVDRERVAGETSVTYICNATGTPTPTITWYYNGDTVMEPGVSVMGSVLSIPSLEARHSGIYQCFARNEFKGRVREDSRIWILEVRPPGKET